jgi:sugar lactone lactonase YvrE
MVKTKKLNFLIVVLIAIIIGIIGCAPPVVQEEFDIVWPLPPSVPRIKYVQQIRSTSDIGKQLGFSDAIFGDSDIWGFVKPYGVAVDKNGITYVADIGMVWAMDLENHDYYFIGLRPGSGKLTIPIAVATSDDGRLFVSDIASDRVKIYSDRRFVGALGEEGKFISVSGLAVDDERGLIYLCDSNRHTIFVYSLEDYSQLRTIAKRGHEIGDLNFPTNIALDSSGNLFVVDTGNFRVQVFDPEGKWVRKFGELGDLPGYFTRPKGIALDSEDNVYVVDAAFQNIQIWNKEGQYLMAFGEGGSDPGQFSLPAGMTIDHQDKLYVVGQLSRRFQVFQYLGEKWKQRQKELEKNVGENGAK